jgi:hypothetical protein
MDEGRELTQDVSTERRRVPVLGKMLAAENRRRVLLTAGALLAAVALFVGVPGYISSQPSFLQRYAHLGGVYKSWAGSVHAKVPCQSCHVRPSGVAQVSYDARMLGEFYLSIVMPSRDPNLFEKPTNAACQSCHQDLRTVSPSGDLNIPHRAHVTVLRLKCIDCHRYLVHEKSPEGKHVPRMADCLRCHDGKTAKNQCSACHTDKVEPLTHRAADWLIVHPTKAGAECNKCHKWTDRWCADCHSKRPRSHAADWRSRHGAAVAKHRGCEACHGAAFCTRCHGEVPQLNFRPTLKIVQ